MHVVELWEVNAGVQEPRIVKNEEAIQRRRLEKGLLSFGSIGLVKSPLCSLESCVLDIVSRRWGNLKQGR